MAMTKERKGRFRRVLEAMEMRLRGDLQTLEDAARNGLGGEAGGSLSNAPMHLGDLGTAQYLQELDATLLENESFIRKEVSEALGRCDLGTYGVCDRCGTEIPDERLEVLPYTRYCMPCSAAVSDGAPVNLNTGRPESGFGGLEPRIPRDGAANSTRTNLNDPDRPFTKGSRSDQDDVHAAGTAGGGTAIGGLAGTNIGEGDPDDGNLEDAMGSGHFDQQLDDDHEDTSTYSGPSGGAVGGAVADSRASGGKTGGGIAPGQHPGESRSD
ncbi:MAG: TraR/DksA C4-type zinc finger protein [Isosphaeraceae bacterium]